MENMKPFKVKDEGDNQTEIEIEESEFILIKCEADVNDDQPCNDDEPCNDDQPCYDEPNHKTYVCKECGRIFNRNYSLQVHMACIHSEARGHKCSVCSKTYKVKTSLTRHMHTHFPNRIECEFCGKTFGSNGLYTQHVKSVHCNVTFKCKICDKVLKSKKGYLEHHKLHVDDRPFQCAHCDASFKWREVLKKHVLNHIPRRPKKVS